MRNETGGKDRRRYRCVGPKKPPEKAAAGRIACPTILCRFSVVKDLGRGERPIGEGPRAQISIPDSSLQCGKKRIVGAAIVFMAIRGVTGIRERKEPAAKMPALPVCRPEKAA
jgi:hypothetical protein